MPSNRWRKMLLDMAFLRKVTAVLLIFAMTGAASALEVIQGDGPSYPIIETSQSEKLFDRIKQKVDQSRGQQPPVRTVRLSRYPQPATEERLRSIDISFVWPFDLKDKNGKVLVQQGKRYNPLSVMTMTSMIVVDGEDQRQLEWAKGKQQELKRALVLICRGDALTVTLQNKLRVYHLNDSLMERFRIERVPCTVEQKEDVLQVAEFVLR
jgi:hypothetical protein